MSDAGGGTQAELVLGDPITDGVGQLGDLTPAEIQQIQSIVDQAGRPLEVVGSAARGMRGPGSDIDYTAASANHPYFKDLKHQLPSYGLEHDLLHGLQDPLDGPAIRFEPFIEPIFKAGGNG